MPDSVRLQTLRCYSLHSEQASYLAASHKYGFRRLRPWALGNIGHGRAGFQCMPASPTPTTTAEQSDCGFANHRLMEDLPGELLCLIARQVLEKEEGMRLWCKLASTCTRLWSFQLPAEPVYRLRNRVKSNSTLHCCHDDA